MIELIEVLKGCQAAETKARQTKISVMVVSNELYRQAQLLHQVTDWKTKRLGLPLPTEKEMKL